MANPFQRAAKIRKIGYFGAVIILFALSVMVRGMVSLPKSVNSWTIKQQSDSLELNEMSQGDVELSGSALRLMLTGSRGIVVCAMWLHAQDKKMLENWHKLEVAVEQITQLQPHFVTPWLFQSWNLTYNVSVEMDRLNDMYFYIARGISLLAEGESINHNSPDIRYALANYYQNKFTVSDKKTTLRCMFQLSCIPKDERRASSLLMSDKKVDMDKLKEFCQKNPILVRRMRDTMIDFGSGTMVLAPTPEALVDFLKDNETLPNRFRDDNDRKFEERLRQFPVLPEAFYRKSSEELNPDLNITDDLSNAVRAAHVWFRYANEAAPEPKPEQGPTPTNYRDPERKRKVPKSPMLIIFLQGPPRAATYIAENIAEEGWFDKTPWKFDAADSDRPWFKGDFTIQPMASSQGAWEKAYDEWDQHQKENGFLLDDTKPKIDKMSIARKYAQSRGVPVGSDVPPPTPEEQQDEEIVESYKACVALRFNNSNLMVTNMQTFLFQAEIEKDPQTIKARKMLFEADQARKNGKQDKAIKIYAEVLGTQANPGLWGTLLKNRGRFLAHERTSEKVLEETYEQQVRYLRLLSEDKKPELQKCTLGVLDVARFVNPTVSPLTFDLMWVTRDLELQKKSPDVFAKTDPMPMPGPFDGLNDGKPWVPEHIKSRVLKMSGIMKEHKQSMQGAAPGARQ